MNLHGLRWCSSINVTDRFVFQIQTLLDKDYGTFKENVNYKKVFVEDNDDRSEEDLNVECINWYGVL